MLLLVVVVPRVNSELRDNANPRDCFLSLSDNTTQLHYNRQATSPVTLDSQLAVIFSLQCSDTVGWVTGRASGL